MFQHAKLEVFLRFAIFKLSLREENFSMNNLVLRIMKIASSFCRS